MKLAGPGFSRWVVSGALAALVASGGVSAQEGKAPPARSPIARFANGFTLDESKAAVAERNLSAWLAGGDVSVWLNLRTSESLPTAVVPNRQPPRALPLAINPAIGRIKADTGRLGTLTLDQFMVHPEGYAQAFIVVHHGQVVYEKYVGMQPTDNHLWMSVAKTLPGLVIEQLVSAGKIDQDKTIGSYLPALRGSGWENVKVRDVMDMTPGLDSEENKDTRANPDSIAVRVFRAEFGMPYKDKPENLLDVLKDAKKQREPGLTFDYGSPCTEVLVYLAEAVTGERWSQYVDHHIWSKLGTEAPLLVSTTPDGVAIAHGIVSSRLRDVARFGMLYTPSWNKVASEQVVTPEILERIRKGVRSREFFRKGFDGPIFVDWLRDDAMTSNSQQWDAIWPDGDMWKSGLMAQGLYVSPKRDLVIAYFSVNTDASMINRFVRPIVTSGMFGGK
ncbi:serine hydrolase domain-containing protein [Luteibacter yeojuensis]|uniref:serine hydrolase domain-containing protein n=1 Tax=Luteibacter yeojuensis TaxID=345309 RepID=UPI0006965940|nr:serine hydrolase domain-containing protein [Luteibacter yeojuensis]